MRSGFCQQVSGDQQNPEQLNLSAENPLKVSGSSVKSGALFYLSRR